jgi:isopenicillin N synthase-like dioxygenase
VLSRKGEWLPINPPPDSLVCNVGDMLQRLTNLRLRIDHPPRDQPAARARQQRALFAAVLPAFNPDFLIKTLPQCIDERHPDQFPEPISAHDFLQERLREIKLI